MNRLTLILLLAFAGVWACEQTAQAQFAVNIPRSRAAPGLTQFQYGKTAPQAMGVSSLGGRQAKPYYDISPRPTLSPFLALGQNETGPLPNYFAFVRPMQEAQEFTRQQRAVDRQLRQELSDVEQRLAYPMSGDDDLRVTGHQTRFMNTLQYYPPVRRKR